MSKERVYTKSEIQKLGRKFLDELNEKAKASKAPEGYTEKRLGSISFDDKVLVADAKGAPEPQATPLLHPGENQVTITVSAPGCRGEREFTVRERRSGSVLYKATMEEQNSITSWVTFPEAPKPEPKPERSDLHITMSADAWGTRVVSVYDAKYGHTVYSGSVRKGSDLDIVLKGYGS